jgi:hypothetical protein
MLSVKTIEWTKIRVSNMPCIFDNSGVYCNISFCQNKDEFRLDIMTIENEPVISFVGTVDGIRKSTMRYFEKNQVNISLEHASYIGSELSRVAIFKAEYIQD